ncbi:MAG TPA: glycosyltransferase [Ignavibacteriales bacterium]|nr:glycosyltransferase [Ignavibacteriales bacterium]
MKITIVSAAYPYRGGIADFARLLYSELAKEHEVNVITFKRQYPSLLFPGKSQTESGNTVEAIPTETLIDSINPLSWIKTGRRILRDSPDLVIFKYWLPFFGPAFGTIARIVRKKKSIKTLAICHNVIPHEKRPGDRAFTRYFLSAMDYFVLLSKKVQDDLKTFLPDAKSAVLPHPVLSNFGSPVTKDFARSHLGLKEGKLMLFFGFIRDYKGLDVLLEAMALLKDRLDVKLMVAGEFYSNEEKYKSLIKKLDLGDLLILFTDFIPTSEVKYYFCASDAVVLPYRSATQSGIVQIAMNFKKPVIAANVGGLEEVVLEGKTGFIVEKENPAMLAGAIMKFYSEAREPEFETNAEKEVEKYSWPAFARGVLELVKK